MVNKYFFVNCIFFVLNVKNTAEYLKNPIFQLNYARYEKMSECKVVCLKKSINFFKCKFLTIS